MNLPREARFGTRLNAGISLVECLVYIAVLTVLMGAGYVALHHATSNHRNLTRNVDNITSAVTVGELWRRDVREATGPITSESSEDGQMIRIPQEKGEATYQFAAGELRRREDAGAAWTVVLPRVKSSNMTADRRAYVTAWRWELTLEPATRRVRLSPSFSFQAVAGSKRP